MRSASGVNLVSAVLQSSLSRAQTRFNLSNPQSLSKRKLLKERKLEQKFQRKLKTLSKENRILSGTKPTDLFQSTQFDWNHPDLQAHKLEFEADEDDQYSSFISDLKSKYTCLNPRAGSTSKSSSSRSVIAKPKPGEKGKKKGKLQKLKNLLKKRTELVVTQEKDSDQERLLNEDKDDDADSGVNLDIDSPPKKNTCSLLEKLRQKRLEARKERKRQKKEALLALTKKSVTLAVTATPKPDKMKETAPVSPESSSPSPEPKSPYNIEAKVTVIPNGNVNGRIPLTSEAKAKKASASSAAPEPKKPTGPQLPVPKIVIYPRENVISGWTKKHPTGCGFINLGNSCYMNATLQALFHTPAFVNWLLTDEDHRDRCNKNNQMYQQCLVCAMHKTLKDSQTQSVPCMRPLQIHNKLKMICKTFSHGRQEDAHEFLRYLLEAMEKAYLITSNATRYDSRSKETTPLGQIFGGYIRTEVTCHKCQSISTTFQPLAELQLDIRHCTTLEDAISYHFRKEKLENNDYKCEKCRNVSFATKQFKIEMAPIVLCLQLKRFTLMGGKINKPVHCNRYIDLTRFQHPSSRGQSALKYRLVGLVTHIGSSPNCGHYTAITEASNKNFYHFDDSSVRQVSTQNALNTDAYVIIYELEKTNSEKVSNSNGLSSPLGIGIQKNGIANTKPSRSPEPTPAPKPIVNPLVGTAKGTNPGTPLKPKPANPFVVPSSAKTPQSKLVLGTGSSSLVSTTPSNGHTSAPALNAKSNERPKINFSIGNGTTVSPGNKFLINTKSQGTLPSTASVMPAPGRPSPGNKYVKSPLAASPSNSKAPDSGRASPAKADRSFPTESKLYSTTPTRKSPTVSSKRLNGLAPTNSSLVPYDDEEEDKGYGSQTPKEEGADASRGGRHVAVKLFSTPSIKKWDGTESKLTAVVNEARKRGLEKTEDDLYDEEMDAGKAKKVKKDARENQHQQAFLNSPTKTNGNVFDKHEEKTRGTTDTFGSPASKFNNNKGEHSRNSSAERYSNNGYSSGGRNGFNNNNGTSMRRYNSTPNFNSSGGYRPNTGNDKYRGNFNNNRGNFWKHGQQRRFSNGGGNGYHNNQHNGYRRKF